MQDKACLRPLRGQLRRLQFGFHNPGRDTTHTLISTPLGRPSSFHYFVGVSFNHKDHESMI